MVFVSLTRINAGSNLFFLLLGVLTLSLSYEEVGGRFLLLGGNPRPDYGVPRWKGRNPEEKQPTRLHHLPAEAIDLPNRVTYTVNANPIQLVHTTNFTQLAPTTERVLLTFDSAAHPSIQFANERFSDFRSARAEEPVAVADSKLLLRTHTVSYQELKTLW